MREDLWGDLKFLGPPGGGKGRAKRAGAVFMARTPDCCRWNLEICARGMRGEDLQLVYNSWGRLAELNIRSSRHGGIWHPIQL